MGSDGDSDEAPARTNQTYTSSKFGAVVRALIPHFQCVSSTRTPPQEVVCALTITHMVQYENC
jgi:hypothetical protein